MNFETRLYHTIGRRIKEARGNKITQEELAHAAGLKRTSITNIEAGNQRIQIHALYMVAKVLQIPVKDLLPDDLEISLEKLLKEQRFCTLNGSGLEKLTEKEIQTITKLLQKDTE